MNNREKKIKEILRNKGRSRRRNIHQNVHQRQTEKEEVVVVVERRGKEKENLSCFNRDKKRVVQMMEKEETGEDWRMEVKR